MRLGIIIVALVAWAAPASATTYFVATTGSNTTCGAATNIGTPAATVAFGIACLVSGDTLDIRAGTYAESIIQSQLTSLTASSYATATTIQGHVNESVILTGGIRISAPGTSLTIAFLIFKNLIVDAGGGGSIVNVGGGGSGGTVNHIKFDGLEVRNFVSYTGIALGGDDGTGTDNWITNSKVHDGSYNIVPNIAHGVYIETANNLVEQSEFFNLTGYGIHNFSTGFPVPSNNTYRTLNIHDNGNTNTNTAFGILLDVGTGNVAYNNLVIHNMNGINMADGNTAFNNTVYNNGQGYGNTLCCYEAIRTLGASDVVRDNIVWNNVLDTIAVAPGATEDHNLCGNGCAGVGDINGQNPLFVNAAGSNFQLASTSSPAYNAGVSTAPTVTTDYAGISRPQSCCYDLGAYELPSGPPPNTVTFGGTCSIAPGTAATATSGACTITSGNPAEFVHLAVNSASISVSSVSWSLGSSAPIEVKNVRNGTTLISIWAIPKPSPGTGTFTFTLSGSADFNASLNWFLNADQVTPSVGADAVTAVGTGVASLTLNPLNVTSNDAQDIAGGNTVNDTPTGATPNQTYLQGLTNVNLATGYAIGVGPLSVTWNQADSGLEGAVAIRIRRAGAPPPPSGNCNLGTTGVGGGCAPPGN